MEYINIIKTDVIDSRYDAFWNNVPIEMTENTPKPVLVICDCAANTPENIQLQKMLDACKLQPEQYNIVRLQKNEQIAWYRLREQLDPKVIFLIGVSPSQLGISASFILHAPNNFSDCTWLPTLSISELEQHADVKRQLWQNGMKPVFIDNTITRN